MTSAKNVINHWGPHVLNVWSPIWWIILIAAMILIFNGSGLWVRQPCYYLLNVCLIWKPFVDNNIIWETGSFKVKCNNFLNLSFISIHICKHGDHYMASWSREYFSFILYTCQFAFYVTVWRLKAIEHFKILYTHARWTPPWMSSIITFPNGSI